MRHLASIALAFALLAALPAFSQSDDDLFGSDETTVEGSTSDDGGGTDFLAEEALRINGSITSKFAFWALWNAPWTESASLLDPDDTGLSPALALSLVLVARPVSTFSIYADVRMAYPFELLAAGTEAGETVTAPDADVFALYAKVMIGNLVFATIGKQPLRWGVGFFYSPADDVFALSAVDVLDPEADREGPLALKLTYSFPGTIASITAYAGLPPLDLASDSADYEIADAALAIKAEALFGNTELALAGFWRAEDRARLIAMATTGDGDFNFFAEALVQFGSDRPYLYKRDSAVIVGMLPTWYYTDRRADGVFFVGTVGGMYRDAESGITIAAQYRFNGEGQDASLDLQDAFRAIAESHYPGNEAVDGDLASYLFGWGMHHAALMFSWTEIFDSDFSLSITAIMSLQDFSGLVMPRLSWTPWDYVTLSIGGTFGFGEEGDEFVGVAVPGVSTGKPSARIDFTVSIGTGSF